MKEFKIILSSFEAVREFVDLSTKQPYPIRVITGDKQTNGKSLIGFFSMNSSVPMHLTVRADNGDHDTADYLTDIAKFLDQ